MCLYCTWLLSFTVLDSEVVDLRVCLRSADKELAEIKSELKGEKHSHQTKIMENMQRVSLIKYVNEVVTVYVNSTPWTFISSRKMCFLILVIPLFCLIFLLNSISSILLTDRRVRTTGLNTDCWLGQEHWTASEFAGIANCRYAWPYK